MTFILTLAVCLSGLRLLLSAGQPNTQTHTGVPQVVVQSECRDRYLWVHVLSPGAPPRFEAVDHGQGVHVLSDRRASRCGYALSTFSMDGFYTMRASFYSCYTYNQNDEAFTFNLQITGTDGAGVWSSHSVTHTCRVTMPWAHRELLCDETFMEVSVSRETLCGPEQGSSKEAWQNAYSLAQRRAQSTWQLLLASEEDDEDNDEEDDGVMSLPEAHRLGYTVTTGFNRVLLRAPYGQPHARLRMVDGIPVEVIHGTVFFRQKLTVVMIDVSMACTLNPGSFDGVSVLWDMPTIMSPLVGSGAAFHSSSVGVGVEGQLLEPSTASARGYTLEYHGPLVRVRVPYGAEGGYRKSMVVDGEYREMYVIFLFYEHVFSLLYGDHVAVETRHRTQRVIDTPLRSQHPIATDQTVPEQHAFRVLLGNIPDDVAVQQVVLNGQALSAGEKDRLMAAGAGGAHANEYTLTVAFNHPLVARAYVGEGRVEFYMDVNYTLTITLQGQSYHHHVFVRALLHNAHPPTVQAACSDLGVTFSVNKRPDLPRLWEVGVGNEPITALLADERGYDLSEDSHGVILHVPVNAIGYTYQDINLVNFTATFQIVVRESKTLEVQAVTARRCLFPTKELIVCSPDGVMTVVANPTGTWPVIRPHRTSLLDRSCRPQRADHNRALYSFPLDSCGTTVKVGPAYMVYENQIVHDRELIADGTTLISRDSIFKVTVRCFYPLSIISNRLSVDRLMAGGFGSITSKQNMAGAAVKVPVRRCPGNTVNENCSPSITDQWAPSTTDYGGPTAKYYGTAGTTEYGAPSTTDYGAPSTTDYGAPSTTDQWAEITTEYGAPSTTDYGAPSTTYYGAPSTTDHVAAITTGQWAAITTEYGAPSTTEYGAPSTTDQWAPITTDQWGRSITNDGTPSTKDQWAPTTTDYRAPTTTDYRAPTTTGYGGPSATDQWSEWTPSETDFGADSTTDYGVPIRTDNGVPSTTYYRPPRTTDHGTPSSRTARLFGSSHHSGLVRRNNTSVLSYKSKM